VPVWQAVVLGLVQGLGEFLPISSSAHLILVPWAFGWDDPGLAFDVALHWGTLVAVLFVFWRDWVVLVKAGLASVLERKVAGDPQRQLFWALVIATVPGAIIGKLLAHKAEDALRSPLLIAGTLSVMGALLWYADKRGHKKRAMEQMGFVEAAFIGLAQACALIPGVSRSGATITAGRAMSYTRESAARFSFLLSIPAVVLSGLFELRKIGDAGSTGYGPTIVATIAAFIVGYATIAWLLRWLTSHSMLVFAIYRVALGAIVLALVYGGHLAAT